MKVIVVKEMETRKVWLMDLSAAHMSQLTLRFIVDGHIFSLLYAYAMTAVVVKSVIKLNLRLYKTLTTYWFAANTQLKKIKDGGQEQADVSPFPPHSQDVNLCARLG
ncbi:hypothetical protein RRG08_031872 [Elysia crispata]|uniref:Uncharacterized protein n=1 Tax=Elysia crispata TaxID=231223 RepID=A0AAE1AI33_9GAST|nr:hypothetical protein RRG08_031872 [Elysia crispata]